MSQPPESEDEALALAELDVRRLVRLLCDALAADDGRSAKLNRLMIGLCEWIGADGWFWVRSRVHPETGVPENYDFLYGGGFNELNLAIFADRSLEVHGPPPENVGLRGMLAHHDHFTVDRTQIIPDTVWAEPVNQDYVQRMGHDAVMYSVRKLGKVEGGEVVSYVLMMRKVGRPTFTPGEVRLAHAIISECGPLHTDGLNLSVASDIATLTPRQRTVLAMLIDGHSTKAAAAHLGLSKHTVNDHCKAIYTHFAVNSRSELLRRFILRP